MNRIYRPVWNPALRAVHVGSEPATSRTSASLRKRGLALACLAALAAYALPASAGTNGGDGANGGYCAANANNSPGGTGSTSGTNDGGQGGCNGPGVSGDGGRDIYGGSNDGTGGIGDLGNDIGGGNGGNGGNVNGNHGGGGGGGGSLLSNGLGGGGGGGVGNDQRSGGGGGGGGGLGQSYVTGTQQNGAGSTIVGGNGGMPGGGDVYYSGGHDWPGGGGGGGAGALITGPGTQLTNAGSVTGGSGGGRGDFVGGGGGGGGALLQGTSLINSGTVSGGGGGYSQSNAGNGGAGVGANRGIITNSGDMVGGAGGDGSGSSSVGGAGGRGVDVDVNSSITNAYTGYIAGGAGGASSNTGGSGDTGVYIRDQQSTLNNAGIITGGNGGGSNGSGGPGIEAAQAASITTSGSIIGGLGGDGTRADAVDLDGQSTLTLTQSARFIGNVVSKANNATLALGGAGNGTLDVSGIVTTASTDNGQYVGFRAFEVDSGTWTLSGSTASAVQWTANAGTLAGTATIGVLTNYANVAPGSSATPYGTLTVAGFQQRVLPPQNPPLPSPTLTIAADGNGSNSVLVVNGPANLDGTLTLNFASPPNAGQRYTVLRAASKLQGSFANLVVNGAPADEAQIDYGVTVPNAVTVSFYPSHCTGANNYNASFFDNFSGYRGQLDPTLWTKNLNGGSILLADNSVQVSSSATQFPFVTSVGSPIPAGGPFSVRWIAQYTGSGGAGDGTLVVSKGLPANNAGDDYAMRRADAWQDSGGFNVRMRTVDGAGSNGYGPIQTDSTDDGVHDIEYCYLASTVEVWVDGTLKQQVSNANISRPDSLWFGNPVNAQPAGVVWNPFTLYYVQVRALNDEIFHDGFGTP